jgi:hypothetical protein
MDSTRRISLLAGVLFLITFVVSIPAAFYFYTPVLDEANYILGAGADTRVAFGALLEVILVIANIGTAVVLYPILKRQNEGVALGYVGARVVESTVIAVGVISLLSIVTLRQDLAGAAGAASSAALGQTLVAVHDWTFLIGPGFMVAIGNGLLLGYLMYRSGLVPRGMAALGLIGGPLLFASSIAVLFGAWEQTSTPAAILVIPEILWELSLGLYLTFKGFRKSGLQKLGFEPVESVSATAPKSELRPAA